MQFRCQLWTKLWSKIFLSELFGYIATGRVNIRRYKEDDPPNNPSGKQDVVWGGVIYFMFLKVSVETLKRFAQRITRLYEQGVDSKCIGEYVRHWYRWTRAGVISSSSLLIMDILSCRWYCDTGFFLLYSLFCVSSSCDVVGSSSLALSRSASFHSLISLIISCMGASFALSMHAFSAPSIIFLHLLSFFPL